MLWGAQEKPANLIFFNCIIASSPSCVPSDWGCPPSWHGCSPPSHPRHRPSSASAQTPRSRWNLIMSCHFIANWFFPQLFNKFWSMTVVVEVGQPDHQLDVLLQEALSKVEHAHAELFFGDLSITVRVKSPDVKKVSVRRRRWLGDCTWMQSSSPPLCQCCPPVVLAWSILSKEVHLLVHHQDELAEVHLPVVVDINFCHNCVHLVRIHLDIKWWWRFFSSHFLVLPKKFTNNKLKTTF